MALVFAFATLGTTGVLAFLRPFSLTTTRVHVLAGAITILLVLEHLVRRLPYFKRQLASPVGTARRRLAGICLVWCAVLVAALAAWYPAQWLMDQGYEARRSAEIVRTSSLVGFGEPSPHRKLIVRTPQQAKSRGLSLYASFPENQAQLPSIAVWAETGIGTMIETLYLPPELSFSDTVRWQQALTRRSHVLPIWRNRYTALSGVGPDGAVDATSGATESHRFALDPYLVAGEDQSFVMCVEVNAPADPNEAWPDGQPSLLYTALVEVDADAERSYAILELTAHGGDAESNGDLRYDLDGFTSARVLVDLLLVKLEALPPERQGD